MYILGINPGHNGTAALLKDGKIIGCVSEERFSRLKNHVGFPFNSVKYLLEHFKINSSELDYVVLSTTGDLLKIGKIYDTFRETYISKNLLKKIFGYCAYKYPIPTNLVIKMKKSLIDKTRDFNSKLKTKKMLSKYFKIPEEKILLIDHHLSHALSTCFNIKRNEETLIFSLDGEGDELCATVNIFNYKKNKIIRIAKTPKSASLGYLYAIVTLYLGMKPNEHEFKVMGLAPYAKKDKIDEPYNLFKKIIWLEDLEFKSKFRLQYADSFMNEKFKYLRFDNIAAAIQKLTEDLVVEWIKKAIKKTGIHNIALSGGVFMNVKANQKIYEIPEVKSLFVMPSAGDESTVFGACFYGYKKYCEENNVPFNPIPLRDLYLGPEYDDEYIENLIKRKNLYTKYKITKPKNINKEVAKLLAKGEIVARCSGKSEWGARALGNRSILANPKNTDTIRILNETIKDRDFWMPFTPSILDKYEKKYVINPKSMFAPYMCITFNSTEKARKEIPAALHPYDFTLRPQIVTKDYNPDYYEIIEEFSKLTGIGGILNTSFNLHGEPNVLTPEDALHTVENSDLKYLAMGSYLFEKIK